MPELMSLKALSVAVIDCGAGIGLFSLLIEHLRQLGILPWEEVFYTLIEASVYNFDQLKRNITRNFADGSYHLLKGLVGRKEGEAEFYESKRQPQSGSLFRCVGVRARGARLPFINVTPFLQADPCLVKVDIEGAEFMFLETYFDVVSNVKGLIIEWHSERGDVQAGEALLAASGFHKAKRSKCKRSSHKGDRSVDLYIHP